MEKAPLGEIEDRLPPLEEIDRLPPPREIMDRASEQGEKEN
jgi:hypothetical protein